MRLGVLGARIRLREPCARGVLGADGTAITSVKSACGMGGGKPTSVMVGDEWVRRWEEWVGVRGVLGRFRFGERGMEGPAAREELWVMC